jgi:hypothetical protein
VTVVATFDYRDERDELLYQVLRHEPKDFTQRRPDPAKPGSWFGHLKCEMNGAGGLCKRTGHGERPHAPLPPTRLVPYRLPELLKAPMDSVIFIPEGEKDVETLVAGGLHATCNAMGVMKWEADWAHFFTGRRVVCLPDNGLKGLNHAKDVTEKLRKATVPEPLIWRVPSEVGEKGDITDWALMNPDVTVRDLLAEAIEEVNSRAAEITEEWELKMAERPDVDSPLDIHIAPNLVPPQGFLSGRAFCRGDLSAIVGKGGAFKTWICMFAAGQFALGANIFKLRTSPARVLFFSEEMSRGQMAERMIQLWDLEASRALAHRLLFAYQVGFDFYAKGKESIAKMLDYIERYRVDMWFLDALSDAHSGDENKSQDINRISLGLKQVAMRSNTAGIVIHHEGKGGGDNPLAGADRMRGHSRLNQVCADVVAVTPARTQHGLFRSTFSLEKMRHHPQPWPEPFAFTILRDESQSKNGIRFEFDDKADEPDEGREGDPQMIANVLRQLGGTGVARGELLAAVRTTLHWKDSNFDKGVASATKLGLIERETVGKFAYFSLPEPVKRPPGEPEPDTSFDPATFQNDDD